MLMAAICHAAPRPLRAETNAPPFTAGVTNPPLRQIGPGVFQIGGVLLNKEKRTIQFPGVVNMTQGQVEYLLVHETGKTHESVLKTSVEPYHIHLAALLLRPKKTPEPHRIPGGPPDDPSGQKTGIVVRWQTGTEPREIPGEELVFNIGSRAAMPRADWIYNGSRVIDGTFLGQRDGSVASVITDPDALLNSMRPGRDKDDIWQVNTNTVPPVNTPVQITLQFKDTDEHTPPNDH